MLLVVIDDLNDWVGPLGGHPLAMTPNLDRLAARGTTFTNAHAQAPLCNPSRTSFLTGLRPTTTGVYALDSWFREGPRHREHPTVFQAFRRAGYRTSSTGKVFHDAYPPAERRGDGSEVDVFGFHGGFGPRPARRLVPGLDHPLVDWGVFPERDEDQDDFRVAEWAIDRLRRPTDGPFFLAVGFRHPHVPLFATQRWFDLYPEDPHLLPPVRPDDRDDVPRFAWYLHWSLPEPRLAWLREHEQWTNKVRSYLASVSFVDDLVGRVLDALDDGGHADDTLVALLSDHGYHLGEKQITGKNSLWERSTRVPLILAGPGVRRGARCARPVELLDVYPTLAELASVEAPDSLDGRSLAPLLRDPAAARSFPAITSHGPDDHAVRDDRYRFIRYADGSEGLYDLAHDPNEWRNLAGDPDLEDVRRRLSAFLPADPARPLPGSRARLIELVDGVPCWEGAPIGPEDAIPGR